MKQIRKAHRRDAKAITDLRIEEFGRSDDFNLLKPELLIWNEIDEAHTVIGVWNENNKAIATMRLVQVADRPQAETVLESTLPLGIKYPGLVFNASATHKNYRRQGFNQLLRYYCIRFAEFMGIQSLLSPVYQKAPRITFMKSLGYICHELERTWQTKLEPKSPRMLCILEAGRFEKALCIIEQSVPGLIREYPWAGPPVDDI